jgi:hypothetical protein
MRQEIPYSMTGSTRKDNYDDILVKCQKMPLLCERDDAGTGIANFYGD